MRATTSGSNLSVKIEFAKERARLLSAADLTWWRYQSDRSVDHPNRQRFDIDRARNPELVACIVEANQRLQAALQQ